MLHSKPAIVFADLVLSRGQETRVAFRLHDRAGATVDLSLSTPHIVVTDQHKTVLIEADGVADGDTVAFFLTCPDVVPEVGEFIATIDPNLFNQPRVAQGTVRFDGTATV